MSVCVMTDCGRRVNARGLCITHYSRWRKHGRPDIELVEYHGHARHRAHMPSRTYVSWVAMKDRCYRRNAPNYGRYGALGITVCADWRDSFGAFLRDMGERPAGKTLDRIDRTRGYEPGNCRWSTPKQQAANRKPPRKRKAA